VVAASCAFVNILHANNTPTTAVHRYEGKFRQEHRIWQSERAMDHQQSAAEGIDMHQKHEEDGEDLPERDTLITRRSIRQTRTALLHTGSSSSCAKHGGPEDEFAQEWVYWQDIPSDARYVSPFHSKHGQEKRYMVRLLFH
jgi:hypothetical protein